MMRFVKLDPILEGGRPCWLALSDGGGYEPFPYEDGVSELEAAARWPEAFGGSFGSLSRRERAGLALKAGLSCGDSPGAAAKAVRLFALMKSSFEASWAFTLAMGRKDGDRSAAASLHVVQAPAYAEWRNGHKSNTLSENAEAKASKAWVESRAVPFPEYGEGGRER